MTTEEQRNVGKSRPDEQPNAGGHTIFAFSKDGDGEKLLAKVREVWTIAASWGRWVDEELGEWPELDECIKQLPKWFGKKMIADVAIVEDWMSLLHDREWRWWSGAVVNNYVKVDIAVDSFPASFLALRDVINMSGGVVSYDDKWINSVEMKRLLETDELQKGAG